MHDEFDALTDAQLLSDAVAASPDGQNPEMNQRLIQLVGHEHADNLAEESQFNKLLALVPELDLTPVWMRR